MESKKIRILLIAFAITLAASGLALGQESVAISVSPGDLTALENGDMADGQKVIVEGIVMSRNDESFTVRDAKGTETVVVMTNKTVITIDRSGIHRDRPSSGVNIRCGVRLKVEGRPDSDGQLVAKNITIESDLKTGKTLESGVHPFKEFGNSTQEQTWSTEESRLGKEVPIGVPLCTSPTTDHCGNYRPSCAEECGAGGCPRRDGCNR